MRSFSQWHLVGRDFEVLLGISRPHDFLPGGRMDACKVRLGEFRQVAEGLVFMGLGCFVDLEIVLHGCSSAAKNLNFQ